MVRGSRPMPHCWPIANSTTPSASARWQARCSAMRAPAGTGRHALVGLLRQSVFGRLAGYEDVNDADRLRHDPAMRWIVGGKAASGVAASPSQMGRFETRWLTVAKNLSALADLSGQWDRPCARPPSTERHRARYGFKRQPDHGEQEMSIWNGHFACTCYHPLFVFNQFGDLERSELRPGNVHSADGWQDVLDPVVARYPARSRASISAPTPPSPIPMSTISGSRADQVCDPHSDQQGSAGADRLLAVEMLKTR